MKAGRPNSIEISQSRLMIEPAAQQNSEDEQILMNEKKGSLENGEGLTEDPMPSSLEPEPEFTTDETSPAYSEIAKATATATKAAAVAAKAAAEVVRLTQGIRLTVIELSREDRAAIRIQAAFRGHLSYFVGKASIACSERFSEAASGVSWLLRKAPSKDIVTVHADSRQATSPSSSKTSPHTISSHEN